MVRLHLAPALLTIWLAACGSDPTPGADAAAQTPDASGICGDDPTPPGETCPAECTGGCADGVCTIMCGPAGCSDGTITCPPDFACEIVCTGLDACDTSTITCPADYACTLTCDEYDACGDVVLVCGSASCSIHCQASGGESCGGSTIQCGTGLCQATCDGAQAPAVTCGTSCGCQPCP